MREAALRVLAQMVPPDELNDVLNVAWADPAFGVRKAVVAALEARGKDVLPALTHNCGAGAKRLSSPP